MPSLLRYLGQNVLKDADVELDCPDYPKLYLELLVFTLKIAQILHQWAFSVDHTDTILICGNLNNYDTYH